MEFRTRANTSLIQTLRLLHAVTEAGFTLQVDRKDEVRFRRLVKIFDMPIAIGSDAPILESILIDHAGPITGVCGMARPPVMPRSTITYCRSRWPDKRPIAVSFAGLLTPWRKTAILEWLANHGQKVPPLFLSDRLNRLKTKILRRLNMTFDQRINIGPMMLSLSDTGRRFPRKSWNVDYYALLLSSRFAFCPNGDVGPDGPSWTYRFFDPIMCGCIPIVDKPHALFAGYHYLLASEQIDHSDWQNDHALSNFAKLSAELTLDPVMLHHAVLDELTAGSS